MIQKQALTPKEAAEVYSLNPRTLANYRSHKNMGPRWYKVGKKKILYRVQDIELWLFGKKGE